MMETRMARQIPNEKAKQGRTGFPVLMVLVAALVLAMLAWAGAELFGDAIEPDNPSGQPATTQPSPAPAQ
jgi:hypothetical protein